MPGTETPELMRSQKPLVMNAPGRLDMQANNRLGPAPSLNVQGYPPSTLAHGPSVPFTAGFPIVVEGPQLPGFTLFVGVGLFSYGRYNCTGTRR